MFDLVISYFQNEIGLCWSYPRSVVEVRFWVSQSFMLPISYVLLRETPAVASSVLPTACCIIFHPVRILARSNKKVVYVVYQVDACSFPVCPLSISSIAYVRTSLSVLSTASVLPGTLNIIILSSFRLLAPSSPSDFYTLCRTAVLYIHIYTAVYNILLCVCIHDDISSGISFSVPACTT